LSEDRISRWLPFLVLGILAISFGAIFARLAQGHGLLSLAVAALRLGLAALIVTPVAWWGQPLRLACLIICSNGH
jgi:hypothetical protein